MVMHCCVYGGTCDGDREKLKEVVMKQVMKYKERIKKANAKRNESTVEKIEDSWIKELAVVEVAPLKVVENLQNEATIVNGS